MQNRIQEQNLHLLDNSVGQVHMTIAQSFEGDIQLLRGVAVTLGEMDLDDRDALATILEDINYSNEFIRMSFYEPNGIGLIVDLDGNHFYDIDISSRAFFQEAVAGREVVTAVIPDVLREEIDVTYYAVPVYQNGRIAGVLCAADEAVNLDRLIPGTVFQDMGVYWLINEQAENIGPLAHTAKIGPEDLTFASDAERQRFLDTLAGDGDGIFDASVRDEKQVVTLGYLGVEHFSLLGITPQQAISWRSNQTVWGAFFLVLAACAIFVLLLIIQRLTMRRNQTALEAMAYVDRLTGLRNYTKFERDVQRLRGQSNIQYYSLWSLDIRQFKRVNGLIGQKQADRLLQALAALLSRNEDADNFCCHISADRFCGIDLADETEIRQRFSTLMEKVEALDVVRSYQINVELCMGVFRLSDMASGLSTGDMLNYADFAKERAKLSIGATMVMFDQSMAQEIHREMELEHAAAAALEQGEFRFLLQPKVDIQHGYVVAGAEALCRWMRPAEGMIPPDEFIPLFERTGFIVELDAYIFEQVCAWLQSHRAVLPPALVVSVNVSRLSFLHEGFVGRYAAIKAAYGIEDRRIELELTESIVMENYADHLETVQQIAAAGFTCSIDDFGSGYSSLNMLKNLPMGVIKLDAAFFRGSASMERERIIVSNFIHMAKDLGITTVAEGVETAEQVRYLQSIGNNLIQGYVFSRPLPPEDFIAFRPQDLSEA